MKLTRQLYPNGRAFKMPIGSYLEKFHKALSMSEVQAFNDANEILNSAIPDNGNFSIDDASDWEKRLGLITNPIVSLENRKLAITRKINHPGNVPARQSFRYLQRQLDAAGFNVFVYENIFADGMGGKITKTPGELTGGVGVVSAQHGDFQHGDFQHGGSFKNIVVNHIDEAIDEKFYVGSNLRSTCFIGGSPIGTFANVELARKDEFRQLILKSKPTHIVGYLFVNYL